MLSDSDESYVSSSSSSSDNDKGSDGNDINEEENFKNTGTHRHILAEHSNKWKGEANQLLKNTRMEDFYLAQPSQIVNKYTADNPKQKTL